MPVIVLCSQSALLCLPVLGLYRYYGTTPTLAFCLYFPVWYSGLSDFHPDHLAVPILFSFFFLEKQGKLWQAVFAGVVLALVKETFALQASFCGLYLVFRKQPKAGAFLVLFGLVYFLVAHQYFQQYFNSQFINLLGGWNPFSSTNFSTIGVSPTFGWLGSSLSEVVLSILSKPHAILWDIISDKGKMVYLFYIFGALGFIPILRPTILVTALPILGISLLSEHPNHYEYTTHYTAGLIAPMIIAFAEGLPKAQEIWKRIGLNYKWFSPLLVTGLLVAHSLLSPSPIGRKFFLQKSWLYHYSIYDSTEREGMIKTAIKSHVPSDSDVVVSVQNSLVWNHLLQRKDVFIFPGGAVDKTQGVGSSELTWGGFIRFVRSGELNVPTVERRWADYVVLDLKRPWFIFDVTCHWVVDKCKDGEVFETNFLTMVEKAKEHFETIFENDGFLILKSRDKMPYR